MGGGVDDIQNLDREQYCYLTTQGRRTGKAHTIEIWFATSPEKPTLYMLSGGRDRADWVKNILHSPDVQVRIGGHTLKGRGRVVQDPAEALTARKLVVAKCYGREYNPAGGWEATSLPVAVDLQT